MPLRHGFTVMWALPQGLLLAVRAQETLFTGTLHVGWRCRACCCRWPHRHVGAAAGPAAGREGFTGPMRALPPQAVLAQLQAVALEACARQAITISVALHRDVLYKSCNDE